VVSGTGSAAAVGAREGRGWVSEDARSFDGDAPAAVAGAPCGIAGGGLGIGTLEGEIVRAIDSPSEIPSRGRNRLGLGEKLLARVRTHSQ